MKNRNAAEAFLKDLKLKTAVFGYDKIAVLDSIATLEKMFSSEKSKVLEQNELLIKQQKALEEEKQRLESRLILLEKDRQKYLDQADSLSFAVGSFEREISDKRENAELRSKNIVAQANKKAKEILDKANVEAAEIRKKTAADMAKQRSDAMIEINRLQEYKVSLVKQLRTLTSDIINLLEKTDGKKGE